MADIERALIQWLPEQFPGSRAATKTPAGESFTEAAAGGLIRVRRVGGGRQQSLLHPRVVLDFFKPGTAAKDFALEVTEALFWKLPGTTVAGVVIGGVEEVAGPSWAPWDDTTVERMTAAYQFHVKNAA